MSERELRDWYLYEATIAPLPDKLTDMQNGLLCSIVVNLARSAESQPVSAADFYFLRDRKPQPPPSPPKDGLTEAERLRAIFYGSDTIH